MVAVSGPIRSLKTATRAFTVLAYQFETQSSGTRRSHQRPRDLSHQLDAPGLTLRCTLTRHAVRDTANHVSIGDSGGYVIGRVRRWRVLLLRVAWLSEAEHEDPQNTQLRRAFAVGPMDRPRANQIDRHADQVLIALNPKAGAGGRVNLVEGLASCLRDMDFQVETTSDLGHLSRRSHALHDQRRIRAVVAAGGDGTATTLVSHIPAGVPMVGLPLGTENLLAKYMNYTLDPERLAETINRGLTVRLDAGSANGRYFSLMVGCGFDADVVRRLHSVRRGNITRLDYAKPIVDTLRSYDYPRLKISYESACDDKTVSRAEIEARWAFVVNLPRYAGGLRFAPDAVGTDGLLNVCTFKEGSWWNALRYLGGVVLGQHQGWKDCVTVRARRVRIEAEGDVPYQLDGDPGGTLPVDIEVLAGRLTLLVSESWAIKHGFDVLDGGTIGPRDNRGR